MGEGSKRRALLMPYLLGFCAVALMMVPQIGLNLIWRLVVRAVLCGALVFLVARRSVRQGALFTALMAVAAWVLDIEEGIVIVFFVVGALAMIGIMGGDQRQVYPRMAVGSLVMALILAAGVCGMMLWRKDSALMPALRSGLKQEWPTLIALLAGGTVGAYASNKKPRRTLSGDS